jgi:hypothetical protein
MVGNTKWMDAKTGQLRVTWISSELQKQTHLVRRTRGLFDSSNGGRKNRLPRPASLETSYDCSFLYPKSCPAKRFLRASPPASKNEAW